MTRATWLRALVVAWLGLLVALPVGALLWKGLAGGVDGIVEALGSPGCRDALRVSLWTTCVSTLLASVLGTVLAWALVRWEFPGRRLLDTLVDLPVAMPTLVIGLLLVAATGPLSLPGAWLGALGVQVAYAPAGIVAALVFVSLPLVVRAVEPALAELDPAEEEAARTMGADELTLLRRVLLPPVVPAIAAGAVQAFARAIAEFGSVAAVSGNVPGRTLTVPVWILGEVESGRADRAAAVSVLLLGVALGLHALGRALAARAVGRPHG